MILLQLKRSNVLKISRTMIGKVLGMNYQTVTRIEKYVNTRAGSVVDLRHFAKGVKSKFNTAAKSIMLDQQELQ